MAAKTVLGLQRLQHRAGPHAAPSLSRQHQRFSAQKPVFEVATIESEYGEEIRKAYEEARQWIEKRPECVGAKRQCGGGFLNSVFVRGTRKASDSSPGGSEVSSPSHLREDSTEEEDAAEDDAPRPFRSSLASIGRRRLVRRQPPSLSRALSHHNLVEPAWYVVEPHSRWKVNWDVFVAIMIVYSVLVVPWRIGFSQEAKGAAFVVDVFIDCCFAIDIILNFFTGYYNDREVFIFSLERIAWRYVTSFFFIDFVSVLPIDHIVKAVDDGDSGTSARITRLLRMVRLMKLGRLFRLKRLQTTLEEKLNINPQVIYMVKVIGQVIFLIHLLACFCYWLASPTCPGGRPEPCDVSVDERKWSTWVRTKNVDRMGVMSRYLASFHLVTATIMAVGYGDLYPTNVEERIFSICVQLIGAVVFGFILSAVTTLIESTSPRDIEAKARMTQLKEWLAGRDLPVNLRHKIWTHYTYLMSHKSVFRDETDFLVNLPTNLRVKLVEQTRMDLIHRLLKVFDGENRILITEVAMLLRPSLVAHYECIVEAGEPPLDIFFVKAGRIEAVLDEEDSEDRNSVEIIASSMHAGTCREAWASGDQHGLQRVMSRQSSSTQGLSGAAGHSDGRADGPVRMRSPSPPAPLHLPPLPGPTSLADKAQSRASLRSSCQSHEVANAALHLSHHAPVGHGVLCAIYRESEALGEFPVSPVRLEGGDLRSEVLALCKDALQGVLVQFPGASDRYAEHQRLAMRSLWEAITSEEWTGSVIWSGPRRRRLNSRILWEGRATPINELPAEALIAESSKPHDEHEHESEIFPTRRKDVTGRIEIRNETEKDLLQRFVIPPNHHLKIRWDFFLGALIFYSVLIIPYRFGFSVKPGPASIAIDIVVDIFFFLDMIVNLHCGFIDSEGVTNTILPEIRRHYLQGWFAVDFLSTFPIDWVLEVCIPDSFSGSNARAVKLLRFARLFRLLKLARVFKLAKLMTLANSFVEISPLFIRMASLTMKICFMAHIVGCFWFYLTSVKLTGNECQTGKLLCEFSEPSTTWLKELTDGDTDSQFKKYIVTIYWVFTTMTTVGYGDIYPTNDLERVYAVIVMIFGATVFGYIIGSIAELSSGQQDALSSNLCILRDFCDERGLTHKIQSFVQRHYQFWYQEMTPLHDEPRLLSELPPSLRKEVILHIHAPAIRSVALFRTPRSLPDWFVATVVRLLEPQAFGPGSDIVGPDEAGLHQDLIFVQEGVCEAYRPATVRVSATGAGANHFQACFQSRLMRKRRRRLSISEDQLDSESDDDREEDEVVEVIQKDMVWGYEPLLSKTIKGHQPKSLVCLRCCPEKPCFVYALRHKVLSDIYAIQVDFGSMVQEVLSETILQQALRQGKTSLGPWQPEQCLSQQDANVVHSSPNLSPSSRRSPWHSPRTRVKPPSPQRSPRHMVRKLGDDAYAHSLSEGTTLVEGTMRNSLSSKGSLLPPVNAGRSRGANLRAAAVARSDDTAMRDLPGCVTGAGSVDGSEGQPHLESASSSETKMTAEIESSTQEVECMDGNGHAADSTGATRTPQGSVLRVGEESPLAAGVSSCSSTKSQPTSSLLC